MPLRPLLSPLCLVASVLCSPVGAQSIAWVEGPTTTDLTLRVVAEAAPTATPRSVLTRVELLQVELSNRTRQQGLRDDVARLIQRRGVRRVELPDNGSLFAYRRDGGRAYGFLQVRADGNPVVVLEEPGLGASGTGTPFDDRIGVAPDGRHAVVPRLDGSIHVVRLDGGRYAGSGTASRHVLVPGSIDPFSTCVGRSVAWFAGQDDRAWRLSLADAASPADVTPRTGAAGARLKPEFAPSADGRAVAFLYGPQRLFSIYLLGEAGAAVRLPPPPAKYEEPGYLPETPDGPRLLLDDDASRLLYVDSTIRDETFVLDVAGVLPTTHWTGDPNFQPYIGVIILPVAMGGAFVAGIGDPGRFDLHAATAGLASTVNLTRTAASRTAPWTEGALVPTDTAVTAGGVLIAGLAPSAGGPSSLVRFGVGGPTAVVPSLRAPLARGAAASGAGPAAYLAASALGDVLLDGATGQPLLAAPAGVHLTTPVAAPGFSILIASVGALRAAVFRLADGGLFAAPGTAVRDALLTGAGGLVLDEVSGLTLVDTAGVHRLAVTGGAANRVVLSGLGTADA